MLKHSNRFKTDGPIRVAFSMRYSSDLQNELSIADQEFQMRREAARLGWIVVEDCIRDDRAVSGQSLLGRDGLLELLELSKKRPRPFDAVMFSDSSRFARRVSDAARVREEFEYYGVFLYFASEGLDSRQPGSEFTFLFKAVQDQNYVKALGEKIRQVQFSRFEAGHVPGGHTYGYRSAPVEDPVRKGPHGQAFVNYCNYEIVEEERKVVVRIFEDYAAGKSYAQIARHLNAEGLRPPQKPRGRSTPSWSKSSIREIVQNTKYKGTFYWGKTSQEREPSGRMKTVRNPESEWATREHPDLRIIEDDLWNRVQFQREMKGAVAAKAFGGMSRTQTAREYLFSGLLRCGERTADGECGANMVLTVGNKYGKARYGCADYRGRGTCKNALTVPVQRLEQAFLEALSAQLGTSELRDVIYAEFAKQLNARLEAEAREARDTASRRTELREEKNILEKQMEELLATIKDVGRSPRLSRE
jgi:site-specific DNA recombinase